MKLEFAQQAFEKYVTIKVNKNPVRAMLFNVDRQT
jgi:hypothetical protein